MNELLLAGQTMRFDLTVNVDLKAIKYVKVLVDWMVLAGLGKCRRSCPPV